MDLMFRAISDEEFPAYHRAASRGFGEHPREEDVEETRKIFEFNRSLAALDGDDIVGTAAAITKEMTVPGGVAVPTAAVTYVAVQPTHRRRGILTELMRRQLEDIHQRGEPLAALWASESSIYGRFGYGPAIECEHGTIARDRSAYATPLESEGRVVFVERERVREMAPQVWERVRLERPGMMSRSDARWDSWMRDPEHSRDGATARFCVVYEREGRVDGYVIYRIKHNGEASFPGSKLIVNELVTATDAAHAALWRFCLDVDLIAEVESSNRPLDDPLRWRLADPRQLRRTPHDALWLRLANIPRALEARRYSHEGRLVLQVRDDFCPWNEGTYVLDGGPQGATCAPTDDGPDLALAAADLAAVYMGGARPSTLARAGRVEERTAGALARSDAMFASEPMPWCPEDF